MVTRETTRRPAKRKASPVRKNATSPNNGGDKGDTKNASSRKGPQGAGDGLEKRAAEASDREGSKPAGTGVSDALPTPKARSDAAGVPSSGASATVPAQKTPRNTAAKTVSLGAVAGEQGRGGKGLRGGIEGKGRKRPRPSPLDEALSPRPAGRSAEEDSATKARPPVSPNVAQRSAPRVSDCPPASMELAIVPVQPPSDTREALLARARASGPCSIPTAQFQQPFNVDGVRRSQRVKVPTLNFWDHERMAYERDGATCSAVSVDLSGTAKPEADAAQEGRGLKRRRGRMAKLVTEDGTGSLPVCGGEVSSAVVERPAAASVKTEPPGRDTFIYVRPLRSCLKKSTSDTRGERPRLNWHGSLQHVTKVESYKLDSELWYPHEPVQCDRCDKDIEYGQEGQLQLEPNRSRFAAHIFLCDGCLCDDAYKSLGAWTVLALAARNDERGVGSAVAQAPMTALINTLIERTREPRSEDPLVPLLGEETKCADLRRGILQNARRQVANFP